MVPGKRSETFDLARAEAKSAERQQKLARLAAESSAASEPKGPGGAAAATGTAKVADGKRGSADNGASADMRQKATKPSPIETMNDGTMRIRPSADPQRAIDAIRERLSNRGVEKRVDTEGNALLRVGSAQAKLAATGPRSVSLSASLAATASSARLPMPGLGAAHVSSKTGAAPRWSYDGDHSPGQWAQLSPEWATCAKGKRQSPIDIHQGIKVDLEAIRFEYRPSAFTVVDTGHTILVNLPPGNAITVSGRRYELLQFHFHKPAEERVDGKPFDMVVHLVHKDSTGKLAVVAVLLEKGSAQGVVQSVWNHLPLEKGDEVEAGVPLDPTALLPAERGYYTYMGSLTTPPCSEGVLWMVMKQPVGVSADQLAIFARLYPMNARPLQADSSRLVKESN